MTAESEPHTISQAQRQVDSLLLSLNLEPELTCRILKIAYDRYSSLIPATKWPTSTLNKGSPAVLEPSSGTCSMTLDISMPANQEIFIRKLVSYANQLHSPGLEIQWKTERSQSWNIIGTILSENYARASVTVPITKEGHQLCIKCIKFLSSLLETSNPNTSQPSQPTSNGTPMSNGLSVKRASLLALLEGFVTSLDDETLTKLSEQQLLMTL